MYIYDCSDALWLAKSKNLSEIVTENYKMMYSLKFVLLVISLETNMYIFSYQAQLISVLRLMKFSADSLIFPHKFSSKN